MHRFSFLFLLLPLLLPACTGGGELADDDDSSAPDDDDASDDDDTGPPSNAEEVTITTADGLTLTGIWRSPPEGADLPAVLLLHQFGRDRDDFLLLRDGFAEAGIATLAIDLRNHGDSDGAPVPFGDLPTDPTQFPEDLQAGLAWLHARADVDTARVGVLGLSVGANLAVLAIHHRAAWGVKTAVVVSANLEDLALLAGTDAFDLASAIYIAADLDLPEADDADALFAMTAEPVDIRRVTNTSAHGVDLLTASPQARTGIVDWFVENL